MDKQQLPEQLDVTDTSSRMERIQHAMQSWRASAATATHPEEVTTEDEGLLMVQEHRAERIARAMSSISGNFDTLVNFTAPLDESHLTLDNGYGKLPVVIMHKMFAKHPFVTKRRPKTNYDAYFYEEDPVEAFYLATKDWPLLDGRREELELKELIDAGLDSFDRLKEGDWQSDDERKQLELSCAVGTDAYLRFYEGNIRLVARILPKYRSKKNLDVESINTAGLLSLPKSISKFDHKKGFKFSTYATWWIKQAMHREYVKIRQQIILPPEAHGRYIEMLDFNDNFMQKEGRFPTTDDLLTEGFSVEEIQHFQRGNPSSLDARVNQDSETEKYDLTADKDTVESIFDQTTGVTDELHSLIAQSHLEERELTILALLYNTNLPGAIPLKALATKYNLRLDEMGERLLRPLVLEEVGSVMGLSRERIRQLEQIAISQIRDPYGDFAD